MNTSKVTSPSPIDIPTLLHEFDASGQSAAAFARARGIAAWRMYSALDRRKGKKRQRPVALSPNRPALIPVRVMSDTGGARPCSALELEIAGGHRLRIGADFDPALLRRVLEALAPC